MGVEFVNTTRPGPFSWGLSVGLAMLLSCFGISLLLSPRECAQLDAHLVEKDRQIAEIDPNMIKSTPNKIGSGQALSSIDRAGQHKPHAVAEPYPSTIVPDTTRKTSDQAALSRDSS